MKHLMAIARRRSFKVLWVLLSLVLITMTVLFGPYLWHTFVVTGLRPWNLRVHSRDDVLALVDREPLRRFDHVYGNQKQIAALFNRASGYEEGDEPSYLVFNRDGFLMRQHCCYESVPGFLDSTHNIHGWYSLDTTIRLLDFVSTFRDLRTQRPYELDTTKKAEYTVVYGWTDYFAHGESKLDSLLSILPRRSYSAKLILLNMNVHDSSFSMQ